MILPDELFDFAYFFDMHASLAELARMAMPEQWKFLKPQNRFYNEDTPILEKYIRNQYRYLAISYNTREESHEKNRLIAFHGPWACFHTGLITPYFQDIYALFELNRRRDTKYNWVFKCFCPASSPKLKGIATLPAKPFWDSRDHYHPEWDIRINFQHILQDPNNLQRIPARLRDQKNLPLILHASVLYARALASMDPSIIAPQMYCRQVQFLMPICLTDMQHCDLAMTLMPCDGYYYGTTCLTLEMAYINARTLSRPSAPWLMGLVYHDASVQVFPYEHIYGMFQQTSMHSIQSHSITQI